MKSRDLEETELREVPALATELGMRSGIARCRLSVARRAEDTSAEGAPLL